MREQDRALATRERRRRIEALESPCGRRPAYRRGFHGLRCTRPVRGYLRRPCRTVRRDAAICGALAGQYAEVPKHFSTRHRVHGEAFARRPRAKRFGQSAGGPCGVKHMTDDPRTDCAHSRRPFHDDQVGPVRIDKLDELGTRRGLVRPDDPALDVVVQDGAVRSRTRIDTKRSHWSTFASCNSFAIATISRSIDRISWL
jgi:hypothetical protein